MTVVTPYGVIGWERVTDWYGQNSSWPVLHSKAEWAAGYRQVGQAQCPAPYMYYREDRGRPRAVGGGRRQQLSLCELTRPQARARISQRIHSRLQGPSSQSQGGAPSADANSKVSEY